MMKKVCLSTWYSSWKYFDRIADQKLANIKQEDSKHVFKLEDRDTKPSFVKKKDQDDEQGQFIYLTQ
jgi:hypothetical protein